MTEQQIALLIKDNERLTQVLDIVLLRNKELQNQVIQLAGAWEEQKVFIPPTLNDRVGVQNIFSSNPESKDGVLNSISSHPPAEEGRINNLLLHSVQQGSRSNAVLPANYTYGQEGSSSYSYIPDCRAGGMNTLVPGSVITTTGSDGVSVPAGNNKTKPATIGTYGREGSNATSAPLPLVPGLQNASPQSHDPGTANNNTALKQISTAAVEGNLQTVLRTAHNKGLQNTAIILIAMYKSARRLYTKDMQRLTGLSDSGISKRIMSMKRFGLLTRVPVKGLVLTEKSIRLLNQSCI